MKAVVLNEFGGPDQLSVQEVDDPEPQAGQVQIRVHAAGVNPVDAANRSDGSWAGLKPPCVLGYDVAGVISRLGPAVSSLSTGQRVMAMTPFPDGAGGYAELVVVDEDAVALLTEATTFTEAAAAPLAAGTAVEVLRRLALAPASSLLVLGASGGVGSFLVQLAARQGLRVIAVGSRRTHPTMKELGAAGCIDYEADPIGQRTVSLAGGTVDAIADLVGGVAIQPALVALRPGGQIASTEPPSVDLGLFVDNNLTFHGVLIGDDGDRTREVAAMLGVGRLRSVISGLFPLQAVAEAHRLIETRHAGGKVVLTLEA